MRIPRGMSSTRFALKALDFTKKRTVKGKRGGKKYVPPPISQCRRWVELAQERLRGPCTTPHTSRTEPRGAIVVCFGLPLELCKPQDSRRATTRGAKFAEAATRRNLLQLMADQALFQGTFPRDKPLEGRPQLRCVRFTSSPTDPYADWAKQAVDILCMPVVRKSKKTGQVKVAQGMKYLKGDKLADVEQSQWCEIAKPGEGFCYIELRS